MHFEVDLNLTTLRCVQPDDSEDDPYLWTFFFTLDGSTVRQPQPGTFNLLGNVSITAGHGGHGNLSASTVASGQTLKIPANVGAHQALLRPIRLELLGDTFIIPGRFVAFCILMEEDATADSSILKAHANLRNFLELQWNDFLSNRLNQPAVLAARSELQNEGVTLTGRPLILAAVERVIGQFVDSLEAPAAEVVEDAVIEDSGIFDLFVNFVDSDDSMGTLQMMFDERQIINAGLQIPIFSPIISWDDGKWATYYELRGGLEATVRSVSTDFVTSVASMGSVAVRSGEHSFDREFICIPSGTTIQWTVIGVEEEVSIHFTYPFLDVRWVVGGIPLTRPSGTVTIPATCRFPEFDASQPPKLVEFRTEQRQVTVRFEVQNQGDGGRLLRLWNHRDDGGYSFIVETIGTPPGTREIPLQSEMVTFEGQTILLGPDEFIKTFNECLARIEQLGEDYAKSKRLGPKDLWGGYRRQETYDEMVQIVDQLAAVRGISVERTARLKDGIARKLQLQRHQ